MNNERFFINHRRLVCWSGPQTRQPRHWRRQSQKRERGSKPQGKAHHPQHSSDTTLVSHPFNQFTTQHSFPALPRATHMLCRDAQEHRVKSERRLLGEAANSQSPLVKLDLVEGRASREYVNRVCPLARCHWHCSNHPSALLGGRLGWQSKMNNRKGDRQIDSMLFE